MNRSRRKGLIWSGILFLSFVLWTFLIQTVDVRPVGVNGNQEAHNSLEHYRTYFELYGERMARRAAELFG